MTRAGAGGAALLLCAAAAAPAGDVREVDLVPGGAGPNLLNPSAVAVDPRGHLAYLLGSESAAMGVLDLRTLALRNVPLPHPGGSVEAYPETGTVYLVGREGVSVAPRGAAPFRLAPAPSPTGPVLDPGGDGVLVLSGGDLVRVAPDASARRIPLPEEGRGAWRFAVDGGRGLVHLEVGGAVPPRVVTCRLGDGALVASRTILPPAEALNPRGIHVHPATGKVLVVLGDSFKGGDNALAVAPPEAGGFRVHPLPGGKDCQNSLLDASSGLLFLANDNTGNATIVDPSGDPPAARHVAVGGKPNGLALDRRRGRLLVQTWGRRVDAVDVAKRSPAQGFDAPNWGHLPRGVAVDEELGVAVAVSGYQGGSGVTVADLRDGKARFLRTGCGPMDAAFAGGRLVLATNDDRLLLVDPAGGGVSEVPCPAALPRALAADPRSGTVAVACGEWVVPNALAFLDAGTRKIAPGPPIPRGPFAAASFGGRAWFLTLWDEGLLEVDLARRSVRRVRVREARAASPRHLAAGGRGAFVLRTDPPALLVVPPGGGPAEIPLPSEPAAVALDEEGGRALVACGGAAPGLCEVDLGTRKVRSVGFGKAPADVAFDPAGATALVADFADGALWRVGAAADRVPLPGGARPAAVAVDPERGAAWAAAFLEDRLLVVRVRLRDLAVETVFEGPYAYGGAVGENPWILSTNARVPLARVLLDGKAGRGAAVDYPGGRVIAFPLR